MEHQVFVPVEVERLRSVLDDPARVARAVPGLQHDAGAEPVAGRLKVRVGGHSVTYRGAVRVVARDDVSWAVEGEAAEARGSGSVRLALWLRVRAVEGGTALTVGGTAAADGRVAEFPADAVASAVGRLLDRFGENLGAVAGEGAEPESPELLSTGDFEPQATTDFETTPDAEDVPVPEPEAEGPAASLEDDESVAEAAHARRTMIGRSAEEVDHAPPRGRYAPVPAPQTVASSTPLRWAAPAAALAVASAVVAIRALRRRR
ncbi:SRPBCC domain-containing protein [Streptomyces edwardsiae]|uniref:SRPBCC domain-containing protein n=1 Tax=Streptomyces edwardsiae TaxID=3075527 RepID=A0ABU2QQN9_9ACTN|nr:SRPBCC domain-containing protein [Streptomyces sp. DSM 41635]MDT0406757.1 SRPBCC domain-containing protein [Streptomyces sp. DSM 41635]